MLKVRSWSPHAVSVEFVILPEISSTIRSYDFLILLDKRFHKTSLPLELEKTDRKIVIAEWFTQLFMKR